MSCNFSTVFFIFQDPHCPWRLSISKTQRSTAFSVITTILRWTTLCTLPFLRGRKKSKGGRRRGWQRQTLAHRATSSEWAQGCLFKVRGKRWPLVSLVNCFPWTLCFFPVLYFFVGRVFTTYHEFHINWMPYFSYTNAWSSHKCNKLDCHA